MKVCETDNYGVRDALIDCAVQYLPEEAMLRMADNLWVLAKIEEEKDDDGYQSRHWLFALESIARQLKDAPLFEKTCLAQWPERPSAKALDIARVYLDAGSPKTALVWLEKIDDQEMFQISERNKLFFEVYKKLGDDKKASKMAWAIFKRNKNTENLNQLFEVAGENQREKAIKEAVGDILESRRFSSSDVEFLIEAGLLDEAETYITSDPERINGDHYYTLRSLVQSLEKLKRSLAASVIYRALLGSILSRWQSKYYHHGVRYLRKLDALALEISDWKNIHFHENHKKDILKNHGRKRSFWAKYN